MNPNGASVPNYNRINEWPLQFLRTGDYDRSYGYLYARTAYGFWWSATASSATYGRYLGTNTGNVYAQNSNFRGNGFALRGVAKVMNFQKINHPTQAIYPCYLVYLGD